MKEGIRIAEEKFHADHITIEAQVYAREFYEKLGFVQTSAPFLEDGIPHVDYNKCVGCGKCNTACPKHLFKIYDKDTKGSIALCSNHSDNKPQIRKDCSVGCFKCGMCLRKCPEQCIDISSGIPKIDYTKCTSCGECIKACPDKVLTLFQDLIK